MAEFIKDPWHYGLSEWTLLTIVSAILQLIFATFFLGIAWVTLLAATKNLLTNIKEALAIFVMGFAALLVWIFESEIGSAINQNRELFNWVLFALFVSAFAILFCHKALLSGLLTVYRKFAALRLYLHRTKGR